MSVLPDAAMLLYLWKNRTIYLGHPPEDPAFTAAASSLFAGLDGDLTVDVAGTEVNAPLVLIPVGVQATVLSHGGKIGVAYLDPYGNDHRCLLQSAEPHSSGVFLWPSSRSDFIELFRKAYVEQSAPEQLIEAFDAHLKQGVKEIAPADARIINAVDLVRAFPDQYENNKLLAEAVGLTQDQLRFLFAKVTGLSVRRYRLWNRLFLTALYMKGGHSLTDAALAAGFSDSAHFAHVFKEMVGVKPSGVLKAMHRIRIIVGTDAGS